MSHWNYRVVHQVFIHENGEKEDSYAIHECYYDDNGIPINISAVPDPASAEDVDGLRDVLSWMIKALDKPVLEYNDF